MAGAFPEELLAVISRGNDVQQCWVCRWVFYRSRRGKKSTVCPPLPGRRLSACGEAVELVDRLENLRFEVLSPRFRGELIGHLFTAANVARAHENRRECRDAHPPDSVHAAQPGHEGCKLLTGQQPPNTNRPAGGTHV